MKKFLSKAFNVIGYVAMTGIVVMLASAIVYMLVG